MYIERGSEKKMFAWDPKYPKGSSKVAINEEPGLGPNFRITKLVTFIMYCPLVLSLNTGI